jgi:hypothetical protein
MLGLPPSADAQLKALGSPVPIEGSTPTDPSQLGAVEGWEQYQKELQEGTAAETERELQRYRDELSKGFMAEGEAAMARGADPSLFRARALESGKRGVLELQGRLADVSLGRRAEALSGLTGAAGAAASERRMLHLGTLAAQQEAQRTLLQQAELQARLREAPYQRLMDLLGRYGDVSGGLTGGGAGFVGGGGVSDPRARRGGGLAGPGRFGRAGGPPR